MTLEFDPDSTEETARVAAIIDRCGTANMLSPAMVDGEPSDALRSLMGEAERCLHEDKDLDEALEQIAENGQTDEAAAEQAELDSAGNPWVSELHIDSRKKYKEGNATAGQFQRRRGKSAADVQAYFLDLNGPPPPPLPETNETPAPPPPPPPAPPTDVTAEMHAKLIALTAGGLPLPSISAALACQGIELEKLHAADKDTHARALAVLEGLPVA